MRKKVFITGGLIAIMLLISSTTAVAASMQLSSSEAAAIKTEVIAGKPIKDVLEEHHITMAQIRAALATGASGKHKLSNTQISNIASKLGLNLAQVQAEIAAGDTLPQILQANHITEDQLKAVFQEEVQARKSAGNTKTP